MDTISNLQIFNQTNFDSGSLSGLGAVVHQITTPGNHRVTMFQGDKVFQSVPLLVRPQAAVGVAAAALPTGLHVNLGDFVAKTGQLGTPTSLPNLEIPAQGYMLFQAPTGTMGFAVQLASADTPNQPPSFDSRQLRQTDLFTTTLLRPGRYSLTNTLTNATGEIRVEYPVIGNTPYTPPDPMDIQVTDQGFQPNSVQLKPAQGLIFHIGNVNARIQITLTEPDDGPKGSTDDSFDSPLNRWTNWGKLKQV
jgi:hypothetical protein